MPQSLRLSVATLAGLLIGVLLGWLLLSGETARPRSDNGAARDSTPRRGLPDARPDDAETPRPADSAPAPVPGGVIRGQATWLDGKPCEGLPLAAELENPAEIQINALSAFAPDERRKQIEAMLQWSRENTRTASTDADGRFQIAGIGDGAWRLDSNDGARPLEKGAIACHAGDDLRVRVRRVLNIKIDLMLDDGKAATTGTVMLSGPSKTLEWQPGKEFPVEVGRQVISARSGNYHKGTAEVDVPPEGLSEPVVVVLKADAMLVVNVRTPTPYYPRLTVNVAPTDSIAPGWPRSPWELLERFMGQAVWGSNPYSFPGLPAGRYTVFCAVWGAEVLGRMDVDYAGGFQQFDMVLPEPDAASYLVLRVFDPAGKPLDGASVLLTNKRSGISGGVPAVIARGGGEYWVRRIPPDHAVSESATPATEYVIDVLHDDYGRKILTVPVGERGELVVRFGAKGKFTVILENLPADRGNFTLSIYERGALSTSGERTGVQAFNPAPKTVQERTEFDLASGPAAVVLKARVLSRYAAVVIVRQEISVPEGPGEVRITVPALGVLRVRVPISVAGDSVTLRTREFEQSVKLDKDRRVEIPNLPPGDYTVESGGSAMIVRMPREGEIEFAGQDYNAVRITFVGKGSSLEEIGLLEGDLVREINGEPPKGTRAEVESFFRRAAESRDATLRAQRDGRWVTLAATAAQWKKIGVFYVRAERVED